MLTTHVHLMLRSRMVELCLHHSCVYMTWCLINSAQGQLYLFTFTITPFAAILDIHELHDPVPENITNNYVTSFRNFRNTLFIHGPTRSLNYTYYFALTCLIRQCLRSKRRWRWIVLLLFFADTESSYVLFSILRKVLNVLWQQTIWNYEYL
jgi:hypothetical protein